MKLKIQLFAEGDGTITYDKEKLNEVIQLINQIVDDVGSSLDDILARIKNICDGENFDLENQELLNDVLQTIGAKKETYVEALSGFSGFISSLIDTFTANEQQISNEIKEWLSSFKTVGEGLKTAYTAPGATQGMNTVKTAANEIISSGVKISQHTRGIVSETVNIIANSGKAIKGLVGSSPQELVQKGVGTIKTLFTNTAAKPGETIISKLFGKLGSSFSSWITGKTA